MVSMSVSVPACHRGRRPCECGGGGSRPDAMPTPWMTDRVASTHAEAGVHAVAGHCCECGRTSVTMPWPTLARTPYLRPSRWRPETVMGREVLLAIAPACGQAQWLNAVQLNIARAIGDRVLDPTMRPGRPC